ncbi:MAG TPA: DHA2 family efflux MFS transporter permease subunit [Stenotrophobium sp.]|nr:DHA2 family efflux MFS transporter permease subunit [Stenotrophobium sp.]
MSDAAVLSIETPAPVEAGGVSRRAWYGYLALALGSFMAVLDIQIVASSINEIQVGLSASIDEIQWVQTSYLIAEVIAVPLSGYMARMLSTRVYYVISALGFTLASAACAGSWSLGSMVVFRAIQGLFGGGMIPTSFATMFLLFPAGKARGTAQVIGGMMTMMASSLGPTIGGYITQHMSWHWLFLLNFIPGTLCAVLVWKLIDIDRPQPEMWRRMDIPGLAFMAIFLGTLEYTLDDGPRHDWFSQQSVAICASLAIVSGVLFFWRVLTTDHPIIELHAFRNRNFAASSMISTLLGVCMFTLIYLTPIFLGQVRGYNPQQIGDIMMIQGVSMFLSAPIAGRINLTWDPRAVILLGLGLIGTGTWLNGHMTDQWGFAQFALPQALRGAGFIFSFIPITNLAIGTLPSSDVHNASGLFNVTRNIGGAIGLALVSTLINHATWANWQALAESTRLSREPVREALGSMSSALAPTMGDASHGGAIAMLARMVEQQAATITYNDMYQLLTWVVLLAMLAVPLLQRPRHGTSGELGH